MFKPVLSIALMTVKEIFRDRLYYLSVFLALSLIGVSWLASFLTIGRPLRVISDFGIAGFGIALSLTSILLGATLLHKEHDRRTVLVVLARPISPFQFYIGKWLGLVLAVKLNALTMALAFALVYLPSGGTVTIALCMALCLKVIQAILLVSLTMLFSVRSSRTLAMILSTGLFLIGVNLSQLEKASEASPVLKAVTFVLPNFEHFNIGWIATYDLPLNAGLVFYPLGYTIAYSALLIAIGAWLFKRKGI